MTFDRTVSSKGQITIPVDIRRTLGLRAGDRVRFAERNGEVSLRPAISDEQENAFRQYAGALGNFPAGIKDINAWIDEIRGRKREKRDSAVDTNIISPLWSGCAELECANETSRAGRLIICSVVYSELIGNPAADAEFAVNSTRIEVDFRLDRRLRREAGARFRAPA